MGEREGGQRKSVGAIEDGGGASERITGAGESGARPPPIRGGRGGALSPRLPSQGRIILRLA